MADTLRTLVAVDSGLDAHEIANTVTSDATISVVGVVEGMDEAWRTLQDSSCDVLVVACEGYSERALALIDGAVKQEPSRPVLVLGQIDPERLRPPRLRGRRRRHPDAARRRRIRFASRSTSSSPGSRVLRSARRPRAGPPRLRPRPQGWLRQDARQLESRRRTRDGRRERRDRRSRPPVRRRRTHARARARTDVLRPRARRWHARRARSSMRI